MLPYKSSSHSAKCVRCASLRSGGRRLAVRTAMEHPIGALPRTPFPASRDFAPVGSMSLDFQVASLSYKSSSFATSRGNESVTDLPFCIIRYDRHSADWLAALASPYPASPDFSTGKRVTRFSGRFASLRIVFPCHPCSGGRIKHRETLSS